MYSNSSAAVGLLQKALETTFARFDGTRHLLDSDNHTNLSLMLRLVNSEIQDVSVGTEISASFLAGISRSHQNSMEGITQRCNVLQFESNFHKGNSPRNDLAHAHHV